MPNSSSFFSKPHHENDYWQALTHIANNNKEAALACVTAIKQGENYSPKNNTAEDIQDFFDKLFIDTVRHDPQTLSRLNLFEAIGIHDHNAHLTDVSAHALLRSLEETKENLQHLNNYSIDTLSPDQRLSYTIFSWLLHHMVAGEEFLFHTYQITQLEGTIINLSALMTQFHALETMQDVEHYTARLTKIPEQFRQTKEFMALQKNKGILPPRFTIEKVISMIEKSIPHDIEQNIFYAHLAKKLPGIAPDNQEIIRAQVRTIIADSVYPAYQDLLTYFTELLEHAQTNHGVWALPNGDAYYTYMLRHHTTTDLSADEIHELGLHEVAKIHAEIRTIMVQEQGTNETEQITTLIQRIAQDPQFYYPNTLEGRAQCIADYTAILERSRKELGHLFELKPKTGVLIERVPEHEEESAAGAYYYEPSADGSRPGIFFANLRNMAEVPKYQMETLTIHEAEPGHHFQLALQCEMKIPMMRKLGICSTAYCEGWALYTEKLAYEHNFYSCPFSKIGHLQDELLRAARLVVDTGIHHKRWSREQAIDYMKEVIGYHHDTIASEVERYFVLPGQACAYKIGQLKILALRKQAQDSLGDAFSIKEFHNEVLHLTNAPLAVLEESIHRYIKRKLAQNNF